MPDDPPSFLRRNSAYDRRCDIFLSSGSDVHVERDRFERLAEVINNQLYWSFVDSPPVVQLNIVRWEQSVPQKTSGDPNGEFRRQAERSHITVVLLHDDIRPGTEDELEAALSAEAVQVSVIWMKPKHPKAQKSVALKKYLQSKKEEIIWDSTGEPGSDEAWLSMVRVLTKAAFEVFKEITEAGDIEGVHYERP